MMDQEQVIAEHLRAMATQQPGRNGEPPELEELRASTEAELAEQLAAMETIRSRNYRGAAGPEFDDERVMAEIDGNGTLVSMEISPFAMRDMDAAELSRACTEALDAARAALSAQLQELVTGSNATDLASTPPVVDVSGAFRHVKEMTWPR